MFGQTQSRPERDDYPVTSVNLNHDTVKAEDPKSKEAREMAAHLIDRFTPHERFDVFRMIREHLATQHREEVERNMIEAKSMAERVDRLQKEIAY